MESWTVKPKVGATTYHRQKAAIGSLREGVRECLKKHPDRGHWMLTRADLYTVGLLDNEVILIIYDQKVNVIAKYVFECGGAK